MLKHLKGARVMQDCSTGQLFVDTGTGGECKPMGGGSWNDLKDKPFYAEEVEEVVLPRTEMFVGGSAKLCYEGESGYIATPFVVGRKYTVVFDGTEYDCLAYDLAQNSVGLTAIALGNPYLVSDAFPYIDMPFAIYSNIDADGDWYTRYTVKTSGTHTFEIRQKVEAVHPLDPKYLPNSSIVSRGTEVILEECKVSYNGVVDCSFVIGCTYKVTLDGETYTCTAWEYNDSAALGNGDFWEAPYGEDVPFLISDKGVCSFAGLVGAEHTIAIVRETIETVDLASIPCDLLIHVNGNPKNGGFSANDVTVKKGSAAEVMEIFDAGGIPVVKVEYNYDYISVGWVNRHRAVFECHVEDYCGALFFYHDVPYGGGAYKFVMHPDESGVLECWFYALLKGSGGQMF